VTVEASLNFSGADEYGYLMDYGSTGVGEDEFGGLTSSPAVYYDQNVVDGDSVYYSGIAIDGTGTQILGAAFSPPVTATGPLTVINATAGSAGWISATCTATFSNVLPGEEWDVEAYAGAGPNQNWACPQIGDSAPANPEVFGPFAVPDGAAYTEMSFDGFVFTSGSPEFSVSRSINVSGTAWANTLSLNPAAEIQITSMPSPTNRQLTAVYTGGPSGDFWNADVFIQGVTDEWEIYSPGAPAGSTLNVAYPPVPPAVTWLSPFPSGVTRSACPVIWADSPSENSYSAVDSSNSFELWSTQTEEDQSQ
jgi:hypothetical protein